jgi:hypothetical protein
MRTVVLARGLLDDETYMKFKVLDAGKVDWFRDHLES